MDAQSLSALWSALYAEARDWLALIGAIKVVVFPLATQVQVKLTEMLTDIARSSAQDDDALVLLLLNSRSYRFFAYLLKWITSFKLPSAETFNQILASSAKQKDGGSSNP